MLLWNAVNVFVLVLFIIHPMPAVLIGIGTIAAAALAMYASIRQDDALEEAFKTPRLQEIRALFPTESEAKRRVEVEFKSFRSQLKTRWDFISFPIMLVALPIVYFAFVDLAATLNGLFWLFQYGVAVLFAATVALASFVLWGAGNLTPSTLNHNYLERRMRDEQAGRLGSSDRNDIQIVNQTANLDSLHRRVETYTLESALLSALSFSSFIAIILSERNYIDDLHNLFPIELSWYPLASFRNAIGSDSVQVPFISVDYIVGNDVPLIALMLLFCATTFLGVLVARLRFNDGYRDAESSLRAAEKLNEKEEKVLEKGRDEDAQIYSANIDMMLQDASRLQEGLFLIMNYMRFSRNLGILFFVLALTLCGLFFGIWVSAVIAALFLGAFLFGYADQLSRRFLRRRVFEQGGLAVLLHPFKRRDSKS